MLVVLHKIYKTSCLFLRSFSCLLLLLFSVWQPLIAGEAKIDLEPVEKQWLQNHPEIKVVMDPDWAPVEFVNENGRYQGISVDYLNQLESILGIRFTIQSGLSWPEAVEAVKNKKADLFTSVAKTKQRESYAIFTRPYISMPIRIFARNDISYLGGIENLFDKTVAVAKGYAIQEWLENDYPQLKLELVENPPEGINKVSQGEVDVFIGNIATTNYYLGREEISNVRVAGELNYANNQSMAVRDDWPVFAQILQKALDAISEKQKDSIYNRWMSIQFERSVDYQLIWQIILFASLVFVAFIYRNRRLNKEITQRKLAENKLLDYQATLEKRVENRTRALSESEKRFRDFFEKNTTVMLEVNPDGNTIIRVNDAASDFYGYTKDELAGQSLFDMEVVSSRPSEGSVKQNLSDGFFTTRHKTAQGDELVVEIYSSEINVDGQIFYVLIVHDISERRLAQDISQLREKLSEFIYEGDMHQLMKAALDEIEQLTGSEIGFFHFIDENQQTIFLQTWSTRTIKEMCFAQGEGLHYPVADAGVWVDCIKQKQPVVHNDYQNLKHKKGLPEGHAPLYRVLTVPVIRNGKICAVIGVGNKKTPYVQSDVELVSKMTELAYDFVERKRVEQQIQQMAYYDTLTGLPNRELLSTHLEKELNRNLRNKKFVAVCYVDIDDFRFINEQYGHVSGDELLKQISSRFDASIRKGDICARIGSDEFAFLLTDLSNMHEGEAKIQKILGLFSSPFSLEGNDITISVCIGLTVYPTDNSNTDTLIRHADQAMHSAKRMGHGNYAVYDMVEELRIKQHLEILDEVKAGIKAGQFEMYFQPKVNLRLGSVFGFEALIRWNHPDKGLILPGGFLPFVDGSAVEIELGEWVIKATLKQVLKWQEQQVNFPVSINISSNHIQSKGFTSFLFSSLDDYPISVVKNIELEVLETSAIADFKVVSRVMNQCIEKGISFSLDDFGTGYSSLTHFRRLPIHMLKIDQNFVRSMIDSVSDMDIVEGVIRLAETLNRPVVAEGVETIELGLILLNLGCQYAQGYGIARPMPAKDIPGWVINWEKENVWQQLNKEEFTEITDIALKVAIFSHQRWLANLNKYVEQKGKIDLPPMDARQCQFGRWYNGLGKARYANQEIYAFIPPVHSRVHDLGERLIKEVEEGNRDEIAQKLKDLNKVGKELVGMLKRLN